MLYGGVPACAQGEAEQGLEAWTEQGYKEASFLDFLYSPTQQEPNSVGPGEK